MYFLLQPRTPSEQQRVIHVQTDTRGFGRVSHGYFVCLLLSIKPPLVATWLGGSGCAALETRTENDSVVSLPQHSLSVFVCLCVRRTSPPPHKQHKDSQTHTHTLHWWRRLALKGYETTFFHFLRGSVSSRGRIMLPPTASLDSCWSPTQSENLIALCGLGAF